MRNPLRLGFSLLAFLSVAACTGTGTGPGSAPKTVNLAIWSNYVAPETLELFKKETGITVAVTNYSSNEELLAKLQAGATGYDVAVPSDYMVFAMAKLGLLTELDPAKIPNAKSLDPRYLKREYDATNRYSLPYDWGTTGIAVNRELYKGPIKGWKDLLTRPELAGKFSLLDDPRETIGAAMKALGFSLNSSNPAELAKAKALLLAAKKRVKAFTSETLAGLTSGEFAVSHAYSSDALQARRATKGKVEFVIPEEGGTVWIDNLVIPKGAKNVEEAHRLVNFLLNPEITLKTVTAILVAPANQEAAKLLSADLKADAMLFPSEKTLSRSELLKDLGEGSSLYDRLWTEIKAE